jgi:hypothetical protein
MITYLILTAIVAFLAGASVATARVARELNELRRFTSLVENREGASYRDLEKHWVNKKFVGRQVIWGVPEGLEAKTYSITFDPHNIPVLQDGTNKYVLAGGQMNLPPTIAFTAIKVEEKKPCK